MVLFKLMQFQYTFDGDICVRSSITVTTQAAPFIHFTNLMVVLSGRIIQLFCRNKSYCFCNIIFVIQCIIHYISTVCLTTLRCACTITKPNKMSRSSHSEETFGVNEQQNSRGSNCFSFTPRLIKSHNNPPPNLISLFRKSLIMINQ